MNVHNQTVLRFVGGNSDKVWAYDHNTEMCYYGRYGRALTENHLPFDESQKRITSKIKKGYTDVSSDFYIEDRELHSADLRAAKTSDWVIGFENLQPEDILAAHIDTVEDNIIEGQEEVAAAFKVVRNIITQFNDQVVLTFTFPFEPTNEVLVILTSLKTAFPNIDIVDHSGNLVQRDVLLSTINLSKDELVSWLITQEIKVFNEHASEQADAYF